MIHVKLYGETGGNVAETIENGISDFEKGLILGLLIGEGHFGGDGKHCCAGSSTVSPDQKFTGPITTAAATIFSGCAAGNP